MGLTVCKKNLIKKTVFDSLFFTSSADFIMCWWVTRYLLEKMNISHPLISYAFFTYIHKYTFYILLKWLFPIYRFGSRIAELGKIRAASWTKHFIGKVHHFVLLIFAWVQCHHHIATVKEIPWSPWPSSQTSLDLMGMMISRYLEFSSLGYPHSYRHLHPFPSNTQQKRPITVPMSRSRSGRIWPWVARIQYMAVRPPCMALNWWTSGNAQLPLLGHHIGSYFLTLWMQTDHRPL